MYPYFVDVLLFVQVIFLPLYIAIVQAEKVTFQI